MGDSINISRKDFLTGGALLGAAVLGGATLSGCSASASGSGYLPESWDEETDIIVVGCGGAGIAAGITAATEGLGECLVLEAAPEGKEGGNTRVSAQCIFIPKSVDGAMTYQRNLNGPYEIEEELLQAWAENICENLDWLQGLDVELVETPSFNPEWRDVEGSEASGVYLADATFGNQSLWTRLWEIAVENEVAVRFDSRARELVFNPETKEVFGVKVETNDSERYIKARKGVILACGGFENNPEMIKDYSQIGYYDALPYGTPYNRGDGHRMAAKIGARFWHMNNFANDGYAIALGGNKNRCACKITPPAKDYIYVGADARRFTYEETIASARHGKAMVGGSSTNATMPTPAYAILGQNCFNAGVFCFYNPLAQWVTQHEGEAAATSNQEMVDVGIMFKADTVEELAEKIGLNPSELATTVSSYNVNAANNTDPDYDRGTDVYSGFDMMAATLNSTEETNKSLTPSIAAFDLTPLEAPFYAVQIHIGIVNSQGGPKRGADGGIVDVDGNPIPRLFGAGEFGDIYGYNYNGGGNVSESMSSGRLAARSAGALGSWDNA